MMDLQTEWELNFAIFLDQFACGKYGRQVIAGCEYIEIERCKLYPRNRGYIKAILWHILHREHFACITGIHNFNTSVIKGLEALIVSAP